MSHSFRHYLRVLNSRGKPENFIRTSSKGKKIIARDILARVVGTAGISNKPLAKHRMKKVIDGWGCHQMSQLK